MSSRFFPALIALGLLAGLSEFIPYVGPTAAMIPALGNLIWFLVKTFSLVFVFVWMRGTLPRARIDQLMGFAWKWLLPASLLNIFATALAVLLTTSGGN